MTQAVATERDACLHCGQESFGAPFCCGGCESVYQLICDAGLDDYYRFRPGQIPKAEHGEQKRDKPWVTHLSENLGDGTPVLLQVQGIHCAACVWLIRRTVDRLPQAARVQIDVASGRITLWCDRDFPLLAWINDVEQFGYKLAPVDAADSGDDGEHIKPLLARTVIALVLAGNVMLLAGALYLGADAGTFGPLLSSLILFFGLVSVWIAAPVFVKPAWRAIGRGIWSFDIPLALAILLASVGSVAMYMLQGDSYFDSIAVFVALMLLGRYLQERTLARIRSSLLSSPLHTMVVRRVNTSGNIETVRARDVEVGDCLLVPAGVTCPVSGIAEQATTVDLSWITGESCPVKVTKGRPIVAGARAAAGPLRVRATEHFDGSSLQALLTAEERVAGDDSGARLYTVLVVAAGAIGFAGWAIWGSLLQAVTVTAAALVVACPCAFGIAVPLARGAAKRLLARRGIFIRRPQTLERLGRVDTVVFDKTGTLTESVRGVTSADDSSLRPEQISILYSLASASSHPRCLPLREAYQAQNDNTHIITEHTGKGVQMQLGPALYRLGRRDWATSQLEQDATLCFSKDRQEIAAYHFDETLRAEVKVGMEQISKSATVYIASGDRQPAVAAVANVLELDDAHAKGEMSPNDKAAWIDELSPQLLFVGDGVNDTLAAQRSSVSMAVGLEWPALSKHVDLFANGTPVAELPMLLRVARRFNRVKRQLLTFAVIYNVGLVGLALAGLISPWLAAVAMPTSSILLMVFAATAVIRRDK